jgi:hypothetical protein
LADGLQSKTQDHYAALKGTLNDPVFPDREALAHVEHEVEDPLLAKGTQRS